MWSAIRRRPRSLRLPDAVPPAEICQPGLVDLRITGLEHGAHVLFPPLCPTPGRVGRQIGPGILPLGICPGCRSRGVSRWEFNAIKCFGHSNCRSSRLDDCGSGRQGTGLAVHRRNVRQARDRPRPAHHPRRPHRHSGLGLPTPEAVHSQRAEQVHSLRQQTLDVAYAAHPERFVRKPPQPPSLPTEIWINPPPKPESALSDSEKKTQ